MAGYPSSVLDDLTATDTLVSDAGKALAEFLDGAYAPTGFLHDDVAGSPAGIGTFAGGTSTSISGPLATVDMPGIEFDAPLPAEADGVPFINFDEADDLIAFAEPPSVFGIEQAPDHVSSVDTLGLAGTGETPWQFTPDQPGVSDWLPIPDVQPSSFVADASAGDPAHESDPWQLALDQPDVSDWLPIPDVQPALSVETASAGDLGRESAPWQYTPDRPDIPAWVYTPDVPPADAPVDSLGDPVFLTGEASAADPLDGWSDMVDSPYLDFSI